MNICLSAGGGVGINELLALHTPPTCKLPVSGQGEIQGEIISPKSKVKVKIRVL